jgi:AAHS family 4-hydroxybenzoate transporter-like MFS transporter
MPGRQTIDVSQLIDDQKIRPLNVLIILISFLVMFSDGYALAAAAYAAPGIVSELHINRASLGPMFSASLFGMLFGAPLFGFVGDRYGRKKGILWSCLVYGISSLAIVASASLSQITFLRFLSGVGLGGLPPNTVSLNAEFAPKRIRATMIVLMFMGITVGGILPGTVYAYLPQFRWRVLFLIGGSFPIVVALAALFFLPESIKFLVLRSKHTAIAKVIRRLNPGLSIPADAEFLVQEPPVKSVTLAHLFADGYSWITPLLWLLFFANLMANFFLNSWMPTLFRDSGLTVRLTAMTMAAYYVGGIVGGLVISRLLDRRRLEAIGFAFALGCLVVPAIGYHLSHNFLIAAVFLTGFCILGNQLGINAISGLVYPTAIRSNGVGWANAIGRCGAIAGPMIGAWLLARNTSLQDLFLVPVLPLALGALAGFAFMRACNTRFGGLRFQPEMPFRSAIPPEPITRGRLP